MFHNVFQHYKGGLYRAIMENVFLESDPKKPMVVYTSLKDGRTWVRPMVEFFVDLVEHQGQKVQRFRPAVLDEEGEVIG